MVPELKYNPEENRQDGTPRNCGIKKKEFGRSVNSRSD